jgi:hypothetical protein
MLQVMMLTDRAPVWYSGGAVNHSIMPGIDQMAAQVCVDLLTTQDGELRWPPFLHSVWRQIPNPQPLNESRSTVWGHMYNVVCQEQCLCVPRRSHSDVNT